MVEKTFLIEGPQPEHDLSYPYTERNEDLTYIQKGIRLKNFRDNINKRNLECEFKLLRRLTENQMYTNQFRDYNPEIVRLDRYNQVVPFKHTMVRLPPLSTNGGESEIYINANYIASSKISDTRAFIATQGPLEGTRGHFWRMIWHNDVKLIIMLCKCKEDGKSQSDQYWKSETEDLEADNLKVILTDSDKTGNLFKRTFTIKSMNDEETGPKEKVVTHYQWVGWPDHGTPLEADVPVLENFVDIMYQERTANPNSPVVIHCSAGIGRSGTLIALYNLDIILRENLHDLEKVRLSVFGVVRRLREQRWGMVNTADQYSFIYRVIADRIDKYYKNAGPNQAVTNTQE